jgi:prephenate dehydratase
MPMGLRVAFQGEAGAFSEEAARAVFGTSVQTLPLRTFEEMFDAVKTGAAQAAMAPIENTLAGSVIKNYDLLVEHNLTIVAEVVLRIVHNLMAVPGARLEGIRRVHSHPVALAQCELFFKAHPHLLVVSDYDTAGSVKDVMTRGRNDEAAIASSMAAQVYGAQILASGIESNQQNFTRFFVLRDPNRENEIPIPATATGCKSSIVFGLANRPGGLYEALAAFATEKVDLTKIESRPIAGRPWEYSFYLDFMGSTESSADGSTTPVSRALEKLRHSTDFVRILGSYPTLRV